MKLRFEEFYRTVTGNSPFSWQVRLAEQASKGQWPARLVVPTSSGKTSLLEIWTYCLAKDSEKHWRERQTPMRLIYVVDRRLIVDAVYERAKRLADMLFAASQDVGHPLHEAAKALQYFSESVPLVASSLRGGMFRESLWVSSPNQPAVLATTVDQAGSRLLFRGYGISPYQRSVQAGLFGCDALYIVDEAHLSSAFLQTLERIRQIQSQAEIPVQKPLTVVAMSATLGEPENPTDTFVLTDRERNELRERLAKPKLCVFREAGGKKSFEEAMVQAAKELAGKLGTGVIAVIVNRVDTARKIFERLRNEAETVLLIGRVRPYDRDKLLDEWIERLSTGRNRTKDPGIRFVVATQTVEVGADFDFDGLVTELAPLSSLRQRLGRLNRIGKSEEAHAIVVRRKEPDGVYDKKHLDEVWNWLRARLPKKQRRKEQALDLCDEALMRILKEAEPPEEVSGVEAPWLSRPYVEQWSQTSLTPHPDPDIAPFLHGKQKLAPDVQVVWRGDITEEQLASAVTHPAILQALNEQLALAPPSVYEAVSLPVWAVRLWLKQSDGLNALGLSDMESAMADEVEQPSPGMMRPVLRYHGVHSEVIMPDEIRPGDTVVVPSKYGGIDEYGWNPWSKVPARDIGDLAGRKGRSRQRLRLHPLLLPSILADSEEDLVDAFEKRLKQVLKILEPEQEDDLQNTEEKFEENVSSFVEGLLEYAKPDVKEMLEEWIGSKNRGWQVYGVEETGAKVLSPGVVLVWRAQKPRKQAVAMGEPLTEEEEESSFIGDGTRARKKPVTLAAHSREVAAVARKFAEHIGLAENLVETVAAAGLFHDIGKADPRFQVMLFGGDEAAFVLAEEPIAKSEMDPHDVASLRRARRLSGYPEGKRHEEISAGLLLGSGVSLPKEWDKQLLQHLVGSHHGRGRPFFPIVKEQNPAKIDLLHEGIRFLGSSATGLERLDAGWIEQFWILQHRYGYWGLAFLEAILRLADYLVSQNEMQQGVGQ